MPDLFPTGYADEIVTLEEVVEEKDTGYREGVYFDIESGDFVRDGQYRVKSATGLESWEQWCYNCLSTEKGAYPCYGDLFGISTVEAFAADTRALAESILTREISEGLQNDPYGRTKYVSDVTFDWISSEELGIHITVVGVDETTIDLTTVINALAR